MTSPSGGSDRLRALLKWMRQEKSATAACIGFILFALSVTFTHGDELFRVFTEGVSAISFMVAIMFEKKPVARVLYGLFLFATVLLIVLDFNISSQLSQLRYDESFEPLDK